MTWHNDGHKMSLVLDKAEIVIRSVSCPHGQDEDASCSGIVKGQCVVEYFLNRYGFDCNVGVAPVSPEMEIAWTLVGEPRYDVELCQVWVIPVADEFFAAWLVSQGSQS